MTTNPVYRFWGWTYDAGQRSLRSPTGEPVSLTPRQQTLLRAFLDRPQQELDRRSLVNALYGAHPPVDSYNGLNINVCRLREKLAGGPPTILSVAGGYYFTPVPEIDV